MNWITKRVITDISQDEDYLRRWSLWLPFGWSVKIHHIVRPDFDRCEHDHPWWFLRIILWGGYFEMANHTLHIRKPWRPWAPWRIYWCGRGFRHRILRFLGKSNWSLVICGPKRDDWGFFTLAGWMHWKEFVNAARMRRILWCDDGTERGT